MNTLKMTLNVGLLGLASFALVQTTTNAAQRPISDFLSRQGQWSLHLDANGNVDCAASMYDGGSSGFLFEPPIPNFIDWTEPQNNTSAVFDYAGLVNAAAGGTLGRAITGASGLGTELFGHKALEVLAGATPSFGSCTLKLVINGPAAGQPLPDFFQMYNGCGPWSFVSVYFVGSAAG